MDTSKRAVIDLTDSSSSSSSHSLTRTLSFSEGDEECSVSKRRKLTLSLPKGFLDPLPPETAEPQKNPPPRELEDAPRTSPEEETPCSAVPRKNMKSKCSPKKKWRKRISRSSPYSLVEVNAALKNDRNRDEKKEELKDAGFDGLLGIKMKKMIRSDIVRYLCSSFDPARKGFALPQGKWLSISARDVHRVYGLPMGKRSIDLDPDYRKGSVSSLAQELGITPNLMNFVNISVLKRELLKECPCRKKYAKMYILYAIGSLLVPMYAGCVSFKYAQFLEPISDIKSYNWAGYVSDKLVGGLTRFIENKGTGIPLGDMHLMVVHYLDHLIDDLDESRGPTCSRWSNKRALKTIEDKAVLATAWSLEEVVEEEHEQLDAAQNSSARDTHRPDNEGGRDGQCEGIGVRRIDQLKQRDEMKAHKTIAKLKERKRECRNQVEYWTRRLADARAEHRLEKRRLNEEGADTP